MNPIDYSIDVQNPVQAAVQGLQLGGGIRQMMFQQDQQQAQLQRQQQMRTDLATLSQQATPEAIARMSLKYPELSEQFKRSYDMLSPAQQQNELNHATQVYAAVQGGRPDLAANLLRDRAAALRNSGDEAKAKAAETMADWAETHPDSFKTTSGLMLSAAMGPEKFATAFSTLGKEQRDAEMQPSAVAKSEAEARIKGTEAANAPGKAALDAANVRSQIEERAGRLALDRDKLRSDVELELYKLRQKAGELDDGAKKLVNDSTVAAVASDQSSRQMLDLATRLQQSGASSGLAAKGWELYKSVTGNQDAVTQLRQEYTRLRSTQVTKMLPPGPASDKDIALAMEGFPKETASPEMMASFVRGMAKLQQYDAAMNSARAEWVNSVGHLGKPKSDIEVDGIKVPAGSTFVDFSRQFMQKRADAIAAQQAADQLKGRSYMRFAQPPAAAGGATGGF